jgi:hypothetical protein
MRPLPGVLAAALLAGCSGRSLPNDVSWESEHFVYKTRAAETEACPDIVAALEDHFQAIQRAIGFDWPQGAKITYYKFHNVVDFDANSACGEAGACAPGTTVETFEAFQAHELAHTYLRKTGYPPALLLEGAATTLSCASWRFTQPVIPWREAFVLDAQGRRAAELYHAGGWLVGHLLATRPAESFIALYRDARDNQTADQFAATFARVYGEALDDVWAQAIATGRPPAFCPWECSRPQAPVDGVTPVPADAVCGVPPTYAITLAQPSELVATLTGVSSFMLGICGDGSVPPAVGYVGSAAPTYVDYMLAAGDYFVTGSYSDAMLTLSPHPHRTFISAGCAASPAAPPWLELTGNLDVMVPIGTWQVDVGWSQPADVLVDPPPSPSTSALCPACDATDDACIAATPMFAEIQGRRTLRVTSAPRAGGPQLVWASLTAL